MSWFGGGKRNDKARKKQIQSLEERDGKAYKVYKMGKNHFRVTFSCPGHAEPIAIQIFLNENFPESPPKLSVDRKYSHKLLDDNGNISNFEELNRWGVQSSLGLIVQKVCTQFSVSSPTIKQNFPNQQQQWGGGGGGGGGANLLPSYQDHLSRAQSGPPQNGMQQNLGYQQPQQMQQSYSMPHYGNNNNQPGMGGGGGGNGGSLHSHEPTFDLENIKLSPPTIIPGLHEKSVSELKEMLNNDKLIEDFAYNIASTLREMKKSSQDGCIATAQANLTGKESIDDKVNEIKESRNEIETLTQLFKNLKNRQNKVLEKFSNEKILQQFDVEMDTIEKECETLKDTFEGGDITHVIYSKKLAKLRTEYHGLAIRKEKLQTQWSRFS